MKVINFVLTLVFVSAIIKKKVDGVSQLQQQSDIDLRKATELLQTLTRELKMIRGDFSDATNLLRKWGMPHLKTKDTTN